MKIFWPSRSKAKGFSFENIAYKYRGKSSILSSSKISNQLEADRNLKSLSEDCNHLEISNLSIKRVHWANRDFSEYRDTA